MLRNSLAFVLLCASAPVSAAEAVRLGAANWQLVPSGKEVDAVYGDYLIRNDKVVAVIGDAIPDRHAHLHCLSVQGAVIDFTLLATNNDQLTAYYPHGRPDTNADAKVGYPPPQRASATEAEIVTARGKKVVIRFKRLGTPIEAMTEYTLADGDSFIQVKTRYRNVGSQPAKQRPADHLRVDRTFTQTPAGDLPVVQAYDRWFGAAYAVGRKGGLIHTDGTGGESNKGAWFDFPDLPAELKAGQEVEVVRYLAAGRDAAEAELAAQKAIGLKTARLNVTVLEGKKPVAGAEVKLPGTAARTDARGRATFGLSPGRYPVTVSQMGRAPVETAVEVKGTKNATVAVGPRAQVALQVTDADGKAIPCKVQFMGTGGTPDPDLGPVQRGDGCKNIYFTPNGRFTTGLPPGSYKVVISRGPEYDAVFQDLTLKPGETAPIAARLAKVVDSRGWISADFHNHSSESGDNSTSPEGRIIALAAEGVDFAASTEHNRIQTYRPRMKALGLEGLMATSDGIELSGRPGDILHMNAFPLKLKAHFQDGGRPRTEADPFVQMRNLIEADGNSEKLVQQNHPSIGRLFFDPGFKTAAMTHVMEVWAGDILVSRPVVENKGQPAANRLFHWLQLVNQGTRIPGVSNTDAHELFHQSGRIRNFVRSSTDDPAKIDEMEVVREAKRGHMVMSSGPFLEVSLDGALPGDEVKLGKGTLKVRVQTPNWFSVDRVQVLVNGAPDPKLNFTDMRDGVVKFDRQITIALAKDAHLIVVAVGERSSTAPVMGPNGGRPIAISNPIYVDVDGNGFVASKDTLGHPLPKRGGPGGEE